MVLQPVDAETQKAMMAFYHKKQEEQKVTLCRPTQQSLPAVGICIIKTMMHGCHSVAPCLECGPTAGCVRPAVHDSTCCLRY